LHQCQPSSEQENHSHHRQSHTSTLGYCIWYSSTRRINHGHETNKAQVFSRKVNLLSVKCKALRELIIRKNIMAETYKMEHKHL
uniref:Uncharacterized protein n=1 Tax=Pygocentrus nattereri TaxID=42514 RepID=A0A3B4BU77_PYGNA